MAQAELLQGVEIRSSLKFANLRHSPQRCLNGNPEVKEKGQHVDAAEDRYRDIQPPRIFLGVLVFPHTLLHSGWPLRFAPAWPVRFDPVIGELANRDKTAPVTFRPEDPGHASQAPRPNKDQGGGKDQALPTAYRGVAIPRSRAWRLRLRRCRQSPRDARGAAVGCIQKCRRPCAGRGLFETLALTPDMAPAFAGATRVTLCA